MAVNAAWRACFEGSNDPTTGAGAAAEARELHGMFTRHQKDFNRRVVVVVLPGASEDDVPNQLRGLQRRVITDVSPVGIEDLRLLLTGQPAHPVPPLGAIPVLPAAVRERIEAEGAVAAAALSATSTLGAAPSTVSPTAALVATSTLSAAASTVPPAAMLSATSELGAEAEERSRLREDAALVEAARRAAAAPSPGQTGDQEDLTSSPAVREERDSELQQLQELSALLQAVLTEQDQLCATLTTIGPNAAAESTAAAALSRQEVDRQLAAMLDRVQAGLELANTCWVVLAAALNPTSPPAWVEDEPAAIRARREQMVSTWAQTVPVPANNPLPGQRARGRVVFSGTSPTSQGPTPRSGVWRLEADDTAHAVAAGVVSDPVQMVPGTGTWYQSTPRGIEPEIYLPVRQEMLELWLLCQLQLLIEALADGLSIPHATVRLRAILLSPAQLTHQLAHNPQGQRLRLVSERRDADGHRLDDATVSRSTDLPTGQPLTTDVVSATVAELESPAVLVGAARRLTIGLVEHFGAETTVVLRPARTDGPLVDPLSAPEALQQLVHQHARALGLRVDGLSPADRRRLADEHRTRARAVLRR